MSIWRATSCSWTTLCLVYRLHLPSTWTPTATLSRMRLRRSYETSLTGTLELVSSRYPNSQGRYPRNICGLISLKLCEIPAWCQWASCRKPPTVDLIVTWPMTSRNPQWWQYYAVVKKIVPLLSNNGFCVKDRVYFKIEHCNGTDTSFHRTYFQFIISLHKLCSLASFQSINEYFLICFVGLLSNILWNNLRLVGGLCAY